jgi:hypothetical protein
LRSFAALCLFLFPDLQTVAADNEPPNLVSGVAFRKALDQPSPTWDRLDLRAISGLMAKGPHVAVILDRRVDPTAERSPNVQSKALRDCFDHLATECGAGATVVGNAVYIGPRVTAAKLRTVVALRKAELKELRISESRRTALNQGRPFRWNDLDRPTDLLSRLGREWHVEIEGLDQIPHDLWAGAVLPDATIIDALTIILAQFDLTFAWTDGVRGVKLEPIPDRVAFDKSYDPPRGVSAAAALTRWQAEIPELEARVAGGKVLVTGTEEHHELVDRLRKGGRTTDKPGPNVAGPVPGLDSQRYSVKVENKPIREVLKNLETSVQGGIAFEYDDNELKAAGIDLDRLVSFETKKDKFPDLLKKALGPVGIAFEIENRTVRLKPAK